MRPQRKIYLNRPRKLAKRDKVTAPNQHWQMDLKYGYIEGMGRFFFQLSLIDVYDRLVRTDNGPQFTAKIFEETCWKWKLTHERIPVKSPNMNAYIESFHSILEDECYSRNEFTSFTDAYRVISEYMDYYNNRRRHGSIGYMAPAKYYEAVMGNQITGEKMVA